MAALSLQGLGKVYPNGARAVRGVSLDIADGEFVVLVGPSGCGKSTTLRMIAGLETVDEGRLLIGGRDVTHAAPAERGVAMVFQSYALYPHMTVEQNLGFALKLARVDAAEQRRRVRRAAEALQLEPLLQRLPRELSGGQRQRVAIGRAIVREPGVFLFDEPLSNLDAALRTQMRLELARLHERLGTTVVYVTHDQVEAMTLGQRIAVFNAGRIEQVGTPMDIYRQPANRFVAGFVGSPRMNLLPSVVRQQGAAVVAEVAGGAGRLPLPTGTRAADGTPCEAGVRPEHLRLAADGDTAGLAAEVERVESLGDAAWVHCRVAGVEQPLCVRADPEGPLPRARSACRLQAAAAHVHLFDGAGRALA